VVEEEGSRAGSALGSAGLGFSLPKSLPEVGSPEGRVLPKLFLEDSTSKTLIQYKHKCKGMRKPKLVVGLGEHDDVGFLRRGFLKSSSSSPVLADCGDFASSHVSSSLLVAPSVVESGWYPVFLSFGVVFVMLHGGVQVQGAR